LVALGGGEAFTEVSSQVEERSEADTSAFELLLEGADEGVSTILQELEGVVLVGLGAGVVGSEESVIADLVRGGSSGEVKGSSSLGGGPLLGSRVLGGSPGVLVGIVSTGSAFACRKGGRAHNVVDVLAVVALEISLTLGADEVGGLLSGTSTDNGGTESESKDGSNEGKDSEGEGEAAVHAPLEEESEDGDDDTEEGSEDAKNTKSSVG